MSSKIAVNGHVAPGFERVEEVFRENFRKRGEVGAACAVFVEGKPVVDLWGGYADEGKRHPWLEHTKTLVFSTTKGMSSLAFASLYDAGRIDFDEPIKTYWPEFGQHGKEAITIRQLLSHEAGLMVVDDFLTVDVLKDKDRLSSILAAQKPVKSAVGKKGYHTWTISLYQSEICRRVDPLNRSIGTLFNDVIAKPLDADFHIGIPSDMDRREIADIIPFNPFKAHRGAYKEIPIKLASHLINPFSMPLKSFINPLIFLSPYLYRQKFVRELEIGSATGVGSARALARVYSDFASGSPTIGYSQKTIKALERFPDNKNNPKDDIILKEHLIYSLGLEKPSSFFRFGSDERAYGHQGAGGSVGFADPAQKLGFAYVMNRMGTNIANDPREQALRDAVYTCL